MNASLEYQKTAMYIRATQEIQRNAATALRELCERFAAEYDCEVMIEGKPPLVWAREDGPYFGHRAHVEVMRKAKEQNNA